MKKLKGCCGYARSLNRYKNEDLHEREGNATLTLKKTNCYKQTEYLEYCCERCEKLGIVPFFNDRFDKVRLRFCCDYQCKDFYDNKKVKTMIEFVKGFLYIDCEQCYKVRKSDPDKCKRDFDCKCQECGLCD